MRRDFGAKGLARNNEELLSALQRLTDCLAIGLGHHVASQFYGNSWRGPMTIATMIAIVLFNLLAESRGLYRPWRSESLSRELRASFAIWSCVVVVLVIAGFVTKTSTYFSRVDCVSRRSWTSTCSSSR